MLVPPPGPPETEEPEVAFQPQVLEDVHHLKGKIWISLGLVPQGSLILLFLVDSVWKVRPSFMCRVKTVVYQVLWGMSHWSFLSSALVVGGDTRSMAPSQVGWPLCSALGFF